MPEATVKTLVVLEFDIPERLMGSAEALPEILTQIEPPSLPFFSGKARVVVSDHADAVIEWLDEDRPPAGVTD